MKKQFWITFALIATTAAIVAQSNVSSTGKAMPAEAAKQATPLPAFSQAVANNTHLFAIRGNMLLQFAATDLKPMRWIYLPESSEEKSAAPVEANEKGNTKPASAAGKQTAEPAANPGKTVPPTVAKSGSGAYILTANDSSVFLVRGTQIYQYRASDLAPVQVRDFQ